MPAAQLLTPAEIEEILAQYDDSDLTQNYMPGTFHFSDGVALGSSEYVNGIFEQFRDRFGEKRKTGAKKLVLRSKEITRVRVLRNLKKEVVG